MRKKVLAVVTAAVLALGCFATVHADDPVDWVITKSEDAINGNSVVINQEFYDGINNGTILINGKKANAAQKKAVKAIKDNKIFALNNMSLDYSLTTDDYTIAGIDWNDFEKLVHLTHLYAQAGTEKVVRVFQIDPGDADASNPVTVKVVDSDVKASKNYGLRHFKDGVWDNTTGTVTGVVNGVVTAKLTGGSPFALVEVAKKDTTDATGTKDAAAKGATTTKTAPKTGEV